MDKFIDLYCQLLIALISLVAPIIIACLSIFNKAKKINSEDLQKQREEISQKHRQKMNEVANGELREIAENLIKEDDIISENSIENEKLLNPKRQSLYIFIPLSIALILMMIDVLVRSNFLNMYNHFCSIIIIFFSFLSFVFALYKIIIVTKVIINMNEKIESI